VTVTSRYRSRPTPAPALLFPDHFRYLLFLHFGILRHNIGPSGRFLGPVLAPLRTESKPIGEQNSKRGTYGWFLRAELFRYLGGIEYLLRDPAIEAFTLLESGPISLALEPRVTPFLSYYFGKVPGSRFQIPLSGDLSEFRIRFDFLRHARSRPWGPREQRRARSSTMIDESAWPSQTYTRDLIARSKDVRSSQQQE
jgi:hypothetical protein